MISTHQQHSSAATPSFAARFDRPLPRELRTDAHTLSTDAFLARYTPSSGPVRLGAWQCTDADRPATRWGPQARNYQATIAVGDRIGTSTAAASGPVAALTAMLHDRGVPVEIAAFHQLTGDGGTATFIRGSDGVRSAWAMGWADDVAQSALRAVIACANRLSE
ncbi:hypothetical protein MMAD_19800 [Mycolicibacterium madagascariense]|uniref:2-isopropylmalate synthase LeuA allosteric (dimerisation) domain-containing protein n=1 Tax=Mycolicibacterium madagascariense TaxID=212765 RepID=A0A7I7XES6_9MYCO|nr:homocitrate synthase [Mycolicibacterium madagascariense]MCV7015387.1 homocitrate synthase [Mycolicibacterium madagascariense]BBZ27685.1 hypothetical protein MMAD_19800 [Mycolicibacterium madagascariense]